MKSMKYILLLGITAIIALTSCQEQYVTYDDAEYVMFSDTLSVVAVESSDKAIGIPVVSTVACDYDRTFGVEILNKKSNAVESVHYSLESNTVVIKAGETAADVLVHGIYDNLEPTDSLLFPYHRKAFQVHRS